MKRKQTIVVACLLAFSALVVSTLGRPQEAAAQATPSFPNSTTTPGGGSADVARSGHYSNLEAPYSRFEISTQTPKTVTVSISACYGDPTTKQVKAWVQPGNNPSSSGATIKQNYGAGNDCSGGRISFNVNTVRDSRYNNQISTATLTVYKVDEGYNNGHAAFQVTAPEGVVSYRGDSARSSPDATSDNNNAFGLWGGGGSPSISFRFAPSCDFSGGNVYLKWLDADAGSASQPSQPASGFYWKLFDVTNGRQEVASIGGGQLGGPSDKGVPKKYLLNGSESIKPGHTYEWNWYGLSTDNALQVLVPFSENSAALGVQCWSLTGNSVVSDGNINPGQTTNFRHSVHNHGPDAASYNWRVWEKYGNGGWQPYGGDGIHSANSSQAGANNPNGGAGPVYSSYSYTFPPGAPPGTQYCQEIHFTTKTSDPTSGTGSSGPICTTLGGTLAGHGIEPHCSYTYAWNDGKTSDGRDLISRISIDGNPAVSGAEIGYGHSKYYIWNYVPTGPSVKVTVTLLVRNPSTGKFEAKTPQTTTVNNCFSQSEYHATCTIDSITVAPDVDPYNLVLSNRQFTVRATITNNGHWDLPANMGSAPLTLNPGDEGGGGSDYNFSPIGVGALAEGNSRTVQFTLTAGPNIANTTLKAHPAYPDFSAFAPPSACSIPIPVYQEFNIIPHADTPSANWENPTTISYTTRGTKQFGPDVTASAQSSLSVQPFGQPPTTVHAPPAASHTYQEQSDTYQYNPPVIRPGDTYCGHVTISPAHGYLGPPVGGNQNVAYGQAVSADSGCRKVVNEPYVHFLGNDVSAGGGLEGGTCISNGGIKTYFNNTATPSGSGVQIGALSIKPSYGFSSALLRGGSTPGPATGLAFANTANIGAVDSGNDAGTGGNLGGKHCLPDYWATKPETLASPDSSANTASVATGETHYIKPSSGTLTIPGGIVPSGKNTALFVDGDVRITHNISYQNSDNYGSIEAVPSLYIIALGHSIVIDNSVSQLDGIYVSQAKSGGGGGTIYTCQTTDVSVVLNACRNQLVVNGSFVADKVYLLRTFGSLRDASPGERLVNSVNKNCSQYTGTGSTNRGDCAAEIFNFSPEIYLSQPGIVPYSGPTKGTYDYISNDRPVL